VWPAAHPADSAGHTHRSIKVYYILLQARPAGVGPAFAPASDRSHSRHQQSSSFVSTSPTRTRTFGLRPDVQVGLIDSPVNTWKFTPSTIIVRDDTCSNICCSCAPHVRLNLRLRMRRLTRILPVRMRRLTRMRTLTRRRPVRWRRSTRILPRLRSRRRPVR
jgi:hypothetical protein